MSIHSQRGAPDIELDVPSADQDDEVVGSAGRRRLVLAAMCAALVAVVSSVSGLNVPQQAPAEGLGATTSPTQWITTGYTNSKRRREGKRVSTRVATSGGGTN